MYALAGVSERRLSAEEYLPLEPKDNVWELAVSLDDIGVLDLRGLRDVYQPASTDELAVTLDRKDLPPREMVEAKNGGPVPVAQTTAERYLYVIFTLKNQTQRPVTDQATGVPQLDAEGKVTYQPVAINTLRVIPDDTYLDVAKITEKLTATVNLFMEIDAVPGEIADEALWPRQLSAVDIRLEAPMTADEKVRYRSNLPYLSRFLALTSEYDLVKGTNTLPEEIPADTAIRGVAFFANIPEEIDIYSLYFSGISNKYRVKRVGKEKTVCLQRMVRFSFEEMGDELEISRDLLTFLAKERVYRTQYMGIYNGKRRLENWENERQVIESLGMTDPVEKWESDETGGN
ncbi:MAG: hypothetical protein ABIF71_10150 [Planctomycetota bacterium]